MTHILLAEDEEPIRQGLIDTLESEGYEVTAVADGEAAIAAVDLARFDMIMLDVMMPKASGYDVCRAIRKRDDHTPVLFLTAKGEEIDKVVGLELGADDYVTKPFGVRELLARIQAILRRTAPQVVAGPPEQIFGAATIHRDEYRAVCNGVDHKLSSREVVLIDLFQKEPHKVFSRDDLLNAAWGIDYYGTTRTLDQHIAQLRKKVEADVRNPAAIVTVHGVGYKYVPPVA